MKDFLVWAAMAGAMWHFFASWEHREIRAAEQATNGTCRVVSNSGEPEDIRPHLAAGEVLRPVLHFGGDHQIVCIPHALRTVKDAKVRLGAIDDLAWASTVARECASQYPDDPYCGGR